ncbi:MAG: folylpolyglutamate synthase/dihydrofolate synthase family protein [Bacillota bacterium]|nr:folylpolyglutamate synthase/dihydrofolate synthase family protein [Bacillota bacterium]MDW7683340.1 folylpolyglutamate synthase/dihydrofolate synthase family protein [Bacillota bacterium]
MNYEEALNWIHGLYRFGSNPGLERISELLSRLGNPQNQLRCVHIAGTNGKGSTAAFLASILEAEGNRVGLYTSPYLEAFTNRMAVNGYDIDAAELVRLVEQVRPHVEAIADTPAGPPTEFEVVTALAFTYFAAAKPDWVVVEVGLGGRLDATNVIVPAVSAITNIGLEHTQVLGDTIEAIAGEKAGIIKPEIPVVTAAQKIEALTVFRRISAERKATLYELDRDIVVDVISSSLTGVVFNYKSPWHNLQNLHIALPGRHQARNAALALAARELLPGKLNESAMRRGLAATRWPGRLEIFSHKPLVLVDAAHNADGILALRDALAEGLGGRKLHLVLGILGDKAVDEILALIAPLATAGLIVTRPDNPRAADPYQVAELARHYLHGAPVVVEEDISRAVTRALSETKEGEALCVSGSFYTISEARDVLLQIFPR